MPRKKIPHFRFYLQDFRDGTGHMSAAEVGDYIRILIEIYDHDGPLAFDPERLRWALNCRPKMVERKIQRLVELGKVFIDSDGNLHNGRADHEIEIRRQWRENHPPVSEETAKKSPEKEAKSNSRVHSRARPVPVPVNKPSKVVSSFHASDLFNGTAPAALGALGCEGRAPSPPFFKAVRAPPSALVQMLVEQGLHKRH